MPGLGMITSSAALQKPEIVIRPLPERAAELGVTTETLSLVTRIATSGDVNTSLAKFNLDNRQIPILVRLNDTSRSDLERLQLLSVPGTQRPRAAHERRRRVARRRPGADHARRSQPQHHAQRRLERLGARRHARRDRGAAVDAATCRTACAWCRRATRAGSARSSASSRSRWRSACCRSTPCSSCCSTSSSSRSRSWPRCRRRRPAPSSRCSCSTTASRSTR